MRILSIEGNIGAGKTTLLKRIQDTIEGRTDIRVIYEPVDLWQTYIDKETNETILQKFYRDPKTYSFPFQIMTFTTRLQLIRSEIAKYPECEVFICERSLDADAHVFAKMLYEDGMIDSLSYQIYRQMYENTVSQYKLDQIVYLDIHPNICRQRIDTRDRVGEESISLEYLEKCKKYHDDWFASAADSCSVIQLTCNAHIDAFIEMCARNLVKH